jgi:xanthomonalisin
MPSNLRIKALVVAMGLAAGSAAFAATPSAVLANTTSVTRATALDAGDSITGPMALTQSMRVTMSLKLRNKSQLDAFVANPHHKNLTHAEFMAKYGPTAAQVEQVKAFMRQQGFSNVNVSADNMLVSGEAPASTVQSAFHTTLVNVRTHNGRMTFANSTEARIPNSLAGVVHEVIGLQNVHRFHVLHPTVEASGSMVGHNPTDFASIYDAGNTSTGSSINVGIITSGSMTTVQSDFSKFLSNNGISSIPMNVVKVDGGGSGTSGDDEWDLDSQDIVGISGGVKALYLYDTASLSTQDLIDDFSAAESADVVRAVNVSLGGCESSSDTNGSATGDNVFEAAGAEGMTFSVSAGDSGSNECSARKPGASWPADSEYVVALGGTDLYTSGTTTWTQETVWNDTGGSPSDFEPQPSWQNGVGQNAGSQYRGVPDVAFDASPNSGAVIIVSGKSEQVGGTSLSSPLFVGTWARTLATNPNLGFAAPLIYADAAAHYATDFHDVTSGSNGSYTAATGWDYCTGFGSIDIANFIPHVAGGVSPPPPPPPPPPGNTFTNNTPSSIPDNGADISKISVTGISGNAPSDLQIAVNITHSWSGDLEIILQAPNGARKVLKTRDGQNDGNINATYTINASSVSADGTWEIGVIDRDPNHRGDTGTLNSWSLTF